jgi:hypothetical protein
MIGIGVCSGLIGALHQTVNIKSTLNGEYFYIGELFDKKPAEAGGLVLNCY